jgi:tetratricopeptide (TPR) repeat protein
MKVVHNSIKAARTLEWLEIAEDHEANEELRDAAEAYEKVIKNDSVNERAYNRLMIIYRKLKEPEKELTVINKGIKAFEHLNHIPEKDHDKKVVNLSRSLMKLTGLADKKGKLLYLPEPLGKWQKRKMIIEKKLKKES